MTHNQPEGDHNRDRTESKAEHIEKRAENKERGEAAHELTSGKLNEKQQDQKAAGEGNRKLSPKEAEVAASRGKLALSAGTIAQGGRMELVERKPDGTETTLIHGLKGEQVKALTELVANTKPGLPFDLNTPVGTAKHSPKSQTGDPLVVGHKAQAPGAAEVPDGSKKPNAPPDQLRELKAGAVELLKADAGVLHGTVNFAVNTLAGIGDVVRMGAAAHRELSGLDLLIKDPDPEGTKKLHEACAGLSVASRVLLQYSTTLNPGSVLYGVNFDPAGNEMALKLAENMPGRIVQEIDQFGKLDTEAKSAKATELLLNIATLAIGGEGLATKGGELSNLGKAGVAGEELSGVARTGQLASESKLLPNIAREMQAFLSQLKELPQPANQKLSDLIDYLDKHWPKIELGPKPLAADGRDDYFLEMRKHSDRGKGYSKGDKAREKANEVKEAKEKKAFELEEIRKEGWKERHEIDAVKYIRDKGGTTITKNKYEHTFPSDSPYRRQTDGVEWELKNMSNVEKGDNIQDRIIAHADDGATKFTGTKEGNGHVFIDARDQRGMTEATAEKGMREALFHVRELKEIRIVGKDFDISLKPKQKQVTRW
jgi:hypothetical protein